MRLTTRDSENTADVRGRDLISGDRVVGYTHRGVYRALKQLTVTAEGLRRAEPDGWYRVKLPRRVSK